MKQLCPESASINLNCFQKLSRYILSLPVKEITIVDPVVHRLIKTSVGITELSPESHVLTGKCIAFKILFANPMSGLKIHIQIAAIATIGTTVGR